MALWKAQRTLLIVGEGYHEEAFLHHVKQLYAPRGCGLAVTIKNARGKGAMHVIDWTIKQIANADFDTVAAMLDTDKDWSPGVAKQARQKKIRVLASEPCFDAVMLRLLGLNAQGEAKTLKKRLAPYLGNSPTERGSYEAHFGKERLEAGRTTEPTMDALLRLFGV
ncbi:MAG: hypothetical protein HZB71_12945 [Betaproteobacteria bacterium]|nr:hypothetical protein [Betaproteobacteria bacterium]